MLTGCPKLFQMLTRFCYQLPASRDCYQLAAALSRSRPLSGTFGQARESAPRSVDLPWEGQSLETIQHPPPLAKRPSRAPSRTPSHVALAWRAGVRQSDEADVAEQFELEQKQRRFAGLPGRRLVRPCVRVPTRTMAYQESPCTFHKESPSPCSKSRS